MERQKSYIEGVVMFCSLAVQPVVVPLQNHLAMWGTVAFFRAVLEYTTIRLTSASKDQDRSSIYIICMR